MNLDEALRNVTVIGAAGKMGSGIATLIANQVAELKIKNPDLVYRVKLIDISEEALDGLHRYLRAQITKMAEKNIVHLRKLFADRTDLVENREIIEAYVQEAMTTLRLGTQTSLAEGSSMVFEAVVENPDLKIDLLKQIDKVCGDDTLYLTNTSSVPIGFLDDSAGLDGRIIGYHFYNPPVVQKLVEVIVAASTRSDLASLAEELGKRLRKKLVPSNDIAGFIGNGHFIRDGLHGISEVERLSESLAFSEAVYMVNRITQDFLIRPMGIFQLIDYVGIDVFQCILQVMRTHLKDDSLHSDLIDSLMAKDIRGGQRSNGTQKDGFLRYEKNRPVAIYDVGAGDYTAFDSIGAKLNPKLGELPESWRPWRKLLVDPGREEKLKAYFSDLKKSGTEGAELALDYFDRTRKIGEKLVEDGVANRPEDVNDVLINGFYWLYGPINDLV